MAAVALLTITSEALRRNGFPIIVNLWKISNKNCGGFANKNCVTHPLLYCLDTWSLPGRCEHVNNYSATVCQELTGTICAIIRYTVSPHLIPVH